MILATAVSKNRVSIRLTDERWHHIITSHLEINSTHFAIVLSVIEHPDMILKGDTGELLAIQKKPGKQTWIVVAYKEVSKDDGFILTAYITTDNRWLFQRKVLWSK